MAYPLNTFNADERAPLPRTSVQRFAQEIALVIGLALIIFLTLALASYSSRDLAWSTSGAGGPVRNWAGMLGAWLADFLYVLLGFSAWWLVAVAVHAWVGTLLRWMHGQAGQGERKPLSPWGLLASVRWSFWVGLALVLAASTGLEWSRLYRLDDALPGAAGGVLGYVGGPLALKWLGFTGSTLLGIAALVVGVALLFRFSWGRVAEHIGAALYTLVERRRSRKAIAEDVELGRQATRERDVVLTHERP